MFVNYNYLILISLNSLISNFIVLAICDLLNDLQSLCNFQISEEFITIKTHPFNERRELFNEGGVSANERKCVSKELFNRSF